MPNITRDPLALLVENILDVALEERRDEAAITIRDLIYKHARTSGTSLSEGAKALDVTSWERPATCNEAFERWWASKVAEGYQYGREPLATVRFGFEAGYQQGTTERYDGKR